jgi:hypothetical protein
MTISQPLTPAPTDIETQDAWATRAGAHAAEASVLRVAQRFQNQVTDLDVARVMLALERGARPFLNRMGRWFVPTGTPLNGMPAHKLSTVIQEMIRTGLVRHHRPWHAPDVLIPAPTHFRVKVELTQPDQTLQHSACLFVGEDLGPMRARLVDRLDLTDCLACEAALSTGTIRGL